MRKMFNSADEAKKFAREFCCRTGESVTLEQFCLAYVSPAQVEDKLRGIGIAIEGLMDELTEGNEPKPFRSVMTKERDANTD